MSYLGSTSLKNLQKAFDIILPFNETRIKYGAYELSLGDEVYLTDSNTGKREKLKIEKEQIIIKPGQFALLLTAEEVNIPKDKIAFISIKAGIKLKGLVNVSGFHVDPGFRGKLVFSVYNAGPSKIILERGEPYFPIWFATIDEETEYKGEHKGQDGINPKYIEALSMGELASPNVLLDKINTNYIALENQIKVVDERKKLIDYIVKTALGIIIFIAIKVLVDWSEYNRGLEEGYTKRKTEASVDSTINEFLLVKKQHLIEIDSLAKLQVQLNDSLKKLDLKIKKVAQ